MTMFNVISILLTLCALFAFCNAKFLKLPNTIALMLFAIVLSSVAFVAKQLGVPFLNEFQGFIHAIDFEALLLDALLGILLFAGALHVNINDLLKQKGAIFTFATLGVLMSTTIIGVLSYFTAKLMGFDLPFIYCILLGTILSPTDPIAVLAILKKLNAPKSLETKFTGESLFNDGVGVVLFVIVMAIASGREQLSASYVFEVIMLEVAGGIAMGFIIGYGAYLMLKSINNYQVEILITLAVVTGGYALCHSLHTSGPLAMVIAGLFIGNKGRLFAMSENTLLRLDNFWELIDEILNSVLFLILGLEIILIPFNWTLFSFGLIAIAIALFARFISVGIPIKLLEMRRSFEPKTIRILTWGGLRGGISLALALSIPQGPYREIILPLTYSVVVFSIVVQGLTVGKLLPKLKT